MSSGLAILYLEDDPSAVQLVQATLNAEHLDSEVVSVDSREDFINAVSSGTFDLILADYALPTFDGLTALQIARDKQPSTPFIFFSGSLGEEVAIDSLRTGATDYVLKDRLPRLVPAIRRALLEKDSYLKRKGAEEALRESEERYRLLIENSNDLVAELSLTGEFQYVSPNFRTILGYESTELLYTSALALVHPEDLLAMRPKFGATQAAATYRCRHKNGAWYWLESSGRRYQRSSGEERAVIISRDITQRKQAEEAQERLEAQLRQAQKMEAIGTLAGGIAHDFNNILGAIIAYAELARMDAESNAAVLDSVSQILKASDRARDLVQQILAFSRKQKQERKPTNIGPIVKEALKLLRSTLPATIQIESRVPSVLPVVLADSTQIHQVLMNLCTNAAHAMRERAGRLEVSALSCMVDEAVAQAHADLHPGLYLKLTVSDTGHGMDTTTIKRIFDPFFTTKAPGEGTGLGLAVAHGILKDHDGAILVHSEPGKGTTFDVYLPAQELPDSQPEIPQLVAHQGRGQRILFVDDEKALCEVARLVLGKLGYNPSVFLNPLEALDQFRTAPNAFDLAIVDLSMPGMSGVDLAMDFLKIRREIPILLATGFSGAWTRERLQSIGIRGLLLKPISCASLATAIETALAERQPTVAQAAFVAVQPPV